MILDMFKKDKQKKEEKPEIKIEIKKKPEVEKEKSLKIEDETLIKKEKPKKEEDYDTTQCIAIGLDCKNDVKKASKAFFNTKNKLKANAYRRFQSYLGTMTKKEIRNIQNLDYQEFVEKEEQIFTTLKNGFAQYLSKGAHLDDETKEIIEFVFGDIKKFPSKGHRYWYYKIYIWQKRELD